ncbi:hypothetical protein J5X92_20130 [Alteromonas sp. K632G]|jgi:hypothetical protein|uniref:hypothetical protein n=1 Tax=Alteromonas sp. K632G TaxID=2820757 RepID=UPI001AD64BE8|nr:hypothetical protein [Alteromonas sp. K632G]MBO7924512.1 hypothetical protein [Alteromonas sp. K632G]|tara:strand:+ start:1560 stop:1766 length:207 start_codon:yes stop_codon:yes gene_type:complete
MKSKVLKGEFEVKLAEKMEQFEEMVREIKENINKLTDNLLVNQSTSQPVNQSTSQPVRISSIETSCDA